MPILEIADYHMILSEGKIVRAADKCTPTEELFVAAFKLVPYFMITDIGCTSPNPHFNNIFFL